MRRAGVLLMTAVVLGALLPVLAGPAGAQDRGPGDATATISPSGSPSPGARPGERRRAPGFVVLLMLLGLGLLWQFQRVRHKTADVSASTLEDLDRHTRPDGGPGPPEKDERV